MFKSSIRLSRYFFKNILRKVFNAPINLYFDKNPTGVILNRFSKDMNVIDNAMPYSIRQLFTFFLQVLSIVAIAAYNIIFILAVIPFLVIFGYFLFKSFVRALKETSRVESVSTSPVLTHLGESMLGSSTIRAFKKSKLFKQNQINLIDRNLLCQIMNKAVVSWFNVRLNLFSIFIVIGSYTYCVFAKDSMDSVLIGVMMVYLVQIQLSLSSFFSTLSLVEQQFVSFSRCHNLLSVPQELSATSLSPTPILKGRVKFESYSARYRPETELVLNSISLNIRAGQKIGVVGRTGAGKSTL